jgi:tRNA-splicing ligase RtcB
MLPAEMGRLSACCRRLDDLLSAQGATVDVLHRLRPIIVVMASNEFDPYKD